MAYASSETYKVLIDKTPPVTGDLFHKVIFYLYRIGLSCPTQTAGHPFYMSIHDYGRYLKDMRTYYVCRLASDSRKRGQSFNIRGHLPAEIRQQLLCRSLYMSGFHIEKSTGFYILLQLGKGGFGKRLQCGILYK